MAFVVDEAADCLIDHGRAGQRAHGAPAVAWVHAGDVRWTGELRSWAAPDGERLFCPACGTTVLARDPEVRVPLALLDDPDSLTPRAHVGVAEQRAWLKPWDGLPRQDEAGRPPADRRSWRPARDPAVTAASTVQLRPITDANRIAIVTLQVAGPQMGLVAPNVVSLLQADHADVPVLVRAVYADETPVGLLLVDVPAEDEGGLPLAGRPFVWRFMIDEHYQGLGFGRRAMAAMLTILEARGDDRVYVSVMPGDRSAGPFYERVGFVDTGKRLEGERVLCRALGSKDDRGR